MKTIRLPKITHNFTAGALEKSNSHWWNLSCTKQARTYFLTFVFTTVGFISSAQTVQTLLSFNNVNGSYPQGGLALGKDGSFYGTTWSGGVVNSTFLTGMGTVFRITTNGDFSTLATFSGTNGAGPTGLLTMGNDGNFYGTTGSGGLTNLNFGFGFGTVFRVSTSGVLIALHTFYGTDGQYPLAGLTLGKDGNLYGTTTEGGSNGVGAGTSGTVFSITTNGWFTTLVSFNGTNGAYPTTALTLGNDGNFYGTVQQGGFNGNWTVFRMATNGDLTTLVSITNGSSPAAALTMGVDGNFYGTTQWGGLTNSTFSSGMGTVFEVTTNGTLTSLASLNVTNGVSPEAALTLGNDGNFFGTTAEGGNTNFNGGNGCGTVFKVTTNGLLTTLFSFSGTNGLQIGGLTLGNDGNFYGTTRQGGITNSTFPRGMGTVFRVWNSLLITIQPTNLLVQAGTTAAFNVAATSVAPLNYQWTFNGTNIAGATNSALTISNVDVTGLGNYQVLISNGFSTTNSSIAILTMSPSLVSPFGGATTVWGKNINISVGAVGSGQLYYQWYENGVPIAGANSATINFASIQFTNAGLYSVVVSSAYGSITNAAYQVVVNPANVSLGFCPSLTIGGVIGYSYIIQSTTNLANPNAWNTLTNLTLTQTVQLWVDTNANAWSPNNPTYFYRILPGQ